MPNFSIKADYGSIYVGLVYLFWDYDQTEAKCVVYDWS